MGNHVVAPGTSVTWRYVVTNLGNVELTNVVVTDDVQGDVICPKQTLAAGESMTCELTATVNDLGQYANIGSVEATDAVTDPSAPATLTASDPSHLFVAEPGVQVIKYTNTADAVGDANTTPGVSVVAGETVTWIYVVTNTGNTPLVDVTVTDDIEGVICTVATLAAGDSTTCERDGVVEVGQYSNVGTVSATPTDEDGGPLPGDLGTPVEDEDPSNYFGADRQISVKKYTNLSNAVATGAIDDADIPAGLDGTTNHVVVGGTPVWWAYVVTNEGNVALDDIVLTDDIEGPVTCPQTTLAAGASMTCVLAGTLDTVGQYGNTATVTGTDNTTDPSAPVTIDDSDMSHAFVANPSIDVEKYVNAVDPANDADTAPGVELAYGDSVTWLYVVTNTGDVTLADISVTDDVEGAATCPATELAPGASMTCSITGTVSLGAYVNVGTVTGTPVDENGDPIGSTEVTDEGAAAVTGEGAGEGESSEP